MSNYVVHYTGPQRQSLVDDKIKRSKERIKKGLPAVIEILKGGPGSGNHGHGGRPGMVGGSTSEGGGSGSKKDGKKPSPGNKKEARNNHKRNVGKAKGKLDKAKKALKEGDHDKAKAHLKEVSGHVKDSLHGLASKPNASEAARQKVQDALKKHKEVENKLGSGHEGMNRHGALTSAAHDLSELIHTVIHETKHALVH
jgi:hypothetical protein